MDAALRAKVDQVLENLAAATARVQAGYAAAFAGRYVQELTTHTMLPADGVDGVPDRLALKPTDQREGWGQGSAVEVYQWPGIVLPTAMPFAVSIDVYDGPVGQGYVIRAELVIAGKQWGRHIHVGPETYRERPWVQITEAL